ncbi:MAG: Nudix family hydrolase [Sterolibacterium sp.]|nr:Nudix family hydrolase [Sterolibacterium sp.]MBP9800759.1 Nudix family hydrolase [Sterolibacterium sp.]
MKRTDVAAAVLLREDGSFLLGRRPAGTFYAGYWEFPGGKVEAGETPYAALVRELDEELGIRVTDEAPAAPWLVREHVYEHAHVRLHFFRIRHWQGEVRDLQHDALSWQSPAAVDVRPLLPANAPVLAALRLPEVYAITQAGVLGMARQLVLLERALARGVRLIQLREPVLTAEERLEFALSAVQICHQYGARLLVNDDAELARRCAADGLHLPARRLQALDQRPDFPLLAASCHDAEELAQAARLGVDFAVLGPVQATVSHPGQAGLGWAQCAALLHHSSLPVYALGGLSPADLPQAWQVGAHGIAAIRAIWQSGQATET